ncbi:hypothetical protein CQZ98_14900 [Pseudomonas sp. MYb115]|nr:hypothetical protein CQZ98_14900 [Pseudomonas sp. MYb115]
MVGSPGKTAMLADMGGGGQWWVLTGRGYRFSTRPQGAPHGSPPNALLMFPGMGTITALPGSYQQERAL